MGDTRILVGSSGFRDGVGRRTIVTEGFLMQ